MNINTLSEANNLGFIDSTKKRYGKFSNASEMEYTGLQDGVEIDLMLSTSKLHQYANAEFNNESRSALINDNVSLSNHLSVSTLNSTYSDSRNDEVCSLQNPLHKKIKFSYLSKNQAITVHHARDIMNKQIKILSHKRYIYVILEYFQKN